MLKEVLVVIVQNTDSKAKRVILWWRLWFTLAWRLASLRTLLSDLFLRNGRRFFNAVFLVFSLNPFYFHWTRRLGFHWTRRLGFHWTRRLGFRGARCLGCAARRRFPGALSTDTPIGLVPTIDAIDREGTEVDDETMARLLAVNPASWGHEVALINEHYAMIGDRLPKRLDAELGELSRRLDDA